MASTIGLRCYQITVHKRREVAPLEFDDDDFELPPREFLTNFISNHASPTQHDERERSWYFEEKVAPIIGSSIGYMRYGTFGFESDLVDSKTKAKNYRRKTDDVEEIPLYYEFWCPEGADFGLAAFQSFQGRSCITLVFEKLQQAFEMANPGYIIKFRKLLPNDGSGSLYSEAPVKSVKLIKRNASSDVTDKYFGEGAPSLVDFQVSLTARRNQNLGSFSGIAGMLSRSEKTGMVVQDGIEFSEAVATIRVGGKYRPVGIFGLNTDAGVIDISGDVTKGPDGHPTFESIQTQANDILTDFYSTLSGQ